jgi:hypothetical protein
MHGRPKGGKKRFFAGRRFRISLKTSLVLCAFFLFFRPEAFAGPGNVSISGNNLIYGIEGAFSGDIYPSLTVTGYKPDYGRLILDGHISKMSSYVEHVREDGRFTLQFPAELMNDLPGGVNDIVVSSWDYQKRSDVVIPPVSIGSLVIKNAVPDVHLDYLSEKITNFRQFDGVPYRRETGRQSLYALKRGNETVIYAPDSRRAFSIPEDWMTGNRVSVVHLNEHETLTSGPQEITIPSRPPAPWNVFSLDESAPGASDGGIYGVNETMEYSLDGGVTWSDCPRWKIENLAPSENCRVRIKAIEGKSFAGRQKKLVIRPAPLLLYRYIAAGLPSVASRFPMPRFFKNR